MNDQRLGKGIVCYPLSNGGDSRGNSFHLPPRAFQFIGNMKEAHIATIVPNAIRGNHYHVGKKEFIVVLFQDSWILAWDQGKGSEPDKKVFTGKGAVLIEIDSGNSHAIKNIGNQMLTVIAVSNKVSETNNNDTFKQVVLS